MQNKFPSEFHKQCLKHITKCDSTIFDNLLKGFALNSDLLFSANLMVRNEEDCIERCLNSIIPFFDEIVIVDTGSTDKTIEIIESINSSKIRLYYHKWNENFSEIRNYMLEKSTGDIIFTIDADEFISDNINVYEFKKTISYIISILDDEVVISPTIIDSTKEKYDSLARIFKNSSSFYFYGCVHEELRRIDNIPLKAVSLDFTLFHDGYESKKIIGKNKSDRNIVLLKKTLKMERNNFRWSFFLMRDLYIFKKFDDELLFLANNCIKKIQTGNTNTKPYERAAYVYIALIFIHFGKIDECENIVKLLNSSYPNNADSLYIEMILDEKKLISANKKIEERMFCLKTVENSDSILNIRKAVLISRFFSVKLQLLNFGNFFPLLYEVDGELAQKIIIETEKMVNVLQEECMKVEDSDIYYTNLINDGCYSG
ncbi:hypothetical protein AM499_08925 [Bacillus sp. FJAT-22090]|uniref:glycosyltransferase family 2 protein n=1 Tax=Bacillus sp. FJAT-22090 TaxID=1581038 RepID=UPI0006AD928B|nr:glycosyltransferase family 2 protein [Bacillus sp. FJAT-22090]ALC85934.1 hypothetical protein AM499_08925 [Bacillus sp. FJAT-22090]